MDDPGEFFDPFAAAYDERIDAGDADWPGPDVPFYRDLAREADGPALELGVGTGRVYLELLEEGLDVDGVDLSAGMLDRLRAKADDRGLDPSVWQADVTEMDPDREYGLVYAPARAFNHLPSLADQRATLENARRALAPGGRFALNTYVPDHEVIAETYGEPQADTVEIENERYEFVSITTLDDAVEGVARHRYELRQDGEAVVERETPLALVSKREFELLFEVAGFADWEAYGGFEGDPLTSTDQEMVWVAEA